MKKVTQAQVAREAGVSVSAVSLVLNGRTGTRIPDTTAKKIRRVADKLGYTPIKRRGPCVPARRMRWRLSPITSSPRALPPA